MGNYRYYEFIIDFFIFIFWTSISHLLFKLSIWNLLCGFFSMFWREACLRFFILALVLFLCEKTGNFLLFFSILISTFPQIKTRTYIKILRHASLHMDLMNAHLKFGTVKCNSSWDIHVQKMFGKKRFFVFTDLHFSEFLLYFPLHYIIR